MSEQLPNIPIDWIQTIGTPMGMLAAFIIAGWRYVAYQTKQTEKREGTYQEQADKHEARINDLVNGERTILLNHLAETNKVLVKTTDALDRFSDTVNRMPCILKKE